MTNAIKVHSLTYDEVFSYHPARTKYIERFGVRRIPDLRYPDLSDVRPEIVQLEVYCHTASGKTEYYALDPELRQFFEERCHQFMDVNALLTAPAVSKAIENIRAEDSRTILQLQGEKQELERQERAVWRKRRELERYLSLSHSVISQLNGHCESFEKAPVWRRLWIALFPSELYK